MATVAELERLKELLDRLGPLSMKQRGELIEADDWNLVVGSLIELSRAAVEDPDTSVPPHEHTDQVGIGWLDPRVRDLVTGGGLADPGLATELAKIRKDLASLRSRLDRLTSSVDQSKVRIDEVAVKDLVRERELVSLNRKLLGAADDRGEIADLRTTLRTIETEVARAVEVGGQLEVGGELIDVPDLVRRVDEVEELRERLTQPDGNLLDAISFEQRLSEVQTSLVTEEDLTTALADLRDDVGGGTINEGALLDRARVAARDVADELIAVRDTELRSLIDARFGDVDGLVEASVADATGSLRDDILSNVRSERADEIGAANAALDASLTALFETRLEATLDGVDGRFAGFEDRIDEQVGADVQAAVTDALSGLDAQLARTSGLLAELRSDLSATDRAVAQVATDIAAATRESLAREAALRDDLLGRIDDLDGSFDGRLDTAVSGARTDLIAEFDRLVAATRRDLQTQLAAAAREAAITEIGILSGQLRTDTQSIVREEVGLAVAATRDEMNTEIAGLRTRLAGMVASEVSRATGDVPTLIRDAMNDLGPEVRRIVDARMGGGPVGPVG